MLIQEQAVEKICASLKQDPHVKAVFVKGSMGRDEHDEHSDIDLYCLVDGEREKQFLAAREAHLEAYRPILFRDDIFIIAPQLIAVYDNLLHIDLFTVTLESFPEKDYFRVLYDPEGLLESFQETQTLELKSEEFRDAVIDVAWFLFQYQKASTRGNTIWAARMLTNVIDHLARVLLHKYAPLRAQLGVKALASSLPTELFEEVTAIINHITPREHAVAAVRISLLVEQELEWVLAVLPKETEIEPLLRRMIDAHTKKVGDTDSYKVEER
ncbi:nucleotidyltransferase domain-containing protein [Planomicrobium sp. CPCC 101079]|uniref:nucleotidyltransferase domain-containing protein n=1 Tax=Planomicrobium sp. CPCC 101079 TaxID=2599618 RepID=UPI0011B589F3|nr:nucleotidyltransferase domain-containing protein [Planomicrobium sp. CPCC 101079]TWT01106.1 nucleotidyltransferase domain-containing protein [Planomicrobium sp. CPCC 101079]